jgi:hypothetical protein
MSQRMGGIGLSGGEQGGARLVEPSRCCRWPEKGGEKRRSYVHSLKLIESSSRGASCAGLVRESRALSIPYPLPASAQRSNDLVPIATTGGRTVPGRSGSG